MATPVSQGPPATAQVTGRKALCIQFAQGPLKGGLVQGQRGSLCPSLPWRWQLAWLFFSRQPVFQEVRMGSSPLSPSLRPVTSPLPALGQLAAADDKSDETVVVTPPGDSRTRGGQPSRRPGAGPP